MNCSVTALWGKLFTIFKVLEWTHSSPLDWVPGDDPEVGRCLPLWSSFSQQTSVKILCERVRPPLGRVWQGSPRLWIFSLSSQLFGQLVFPENQVVSHNPPADRRKLLEGVKFFTYSVLLTVAVSNLSLNYVLSPRGG
eukprot:jgi/Botrbrau1/12616/Bobra.0169s0143.1